MSDESPFLQVQEDFGTEAIAANEYIAPIPYVTEKLGNVTNRVNASLAKGGLLKSGENKSGLAFLIITPKGRPLENSRSATSQIVTVRVALFTRPLINEGAQGFQKPPLTVLWQMIRAGCSWNRGPGSDPVELQDWDSRENSNGEISYFADFGVPMVLQF